MTNASAEAITSSIWVHISPAEVFVALVAALFSSEIFYRIGEFLAIAVARIDS
jgi:hypothetical protein